MCTVHMYTQTTTRTQEHTEHMKLNVACFAVATTASTTTANKFTNTNQNKTDKNITKTTNEQKLKGTNELCVYIFNTYYIHITSVIYDKCRYMHTKNRMKSEQ